MIEVKNLCKTYISNKKSSTKALSNINLTLPDNGMIFITGQTGSGKTTLLNMIGLIDSYDSGEIILFDKSYNNLSEKEKDSIRRNNIGFVFQDYNLIPDLSVYENLCLVYKILNKEVNNQEIDYYLNLFEMNETKNKYINELSGGQKQRISIIRAIIKKPNIILADEPTSALDDDTSEVIFKKLQEISKDTLVLIVSHNQKLSEKYADRIIEIKKGEIVSDNSINELYYKNNHLDYIDNKFSFKELLKLAIKFINTKKKILLFSLSILILFNLLISLLMGLLTIQNSKVLSYATHNTIDYTFIGNQKFLYDDTDFLNKQVSLTELNNISKDLNKKVYCVNNKYSYSLSEYLCDDMFYELKIYGGINYEESIIEDLNLTVLNGRLPANNQELMVSHFAATCFLKTIGFNINSIEDLINRSISVNDNKYVITGIFDENIDIDKKYEEYKQASNQEKALDDFENEMLYKVSSYFIINDSDFFTDDNITTLRAFYNNYDDDINISYYDNTQHQNLDIIGLKHNLGDNEIIMSYETFGGLEYKGRKIRDILNSYTEEEQRIEIEKILDSLESFSMSFSVTGSSKKIKYYSKDVKVIGVLLNSLQEVNILFNKKMYQDILKETSTYDYNGGFISLACSLKEKMITFKYLDDNVKSNIYSINEYSIVLHRVQKSVQSSQKELSLLIVILSLVSVLLVFYFERTNFKANMKKYKVLKNNGLSNRYLLYIKVNCILILLFLSLLLTLILNFVMFYFSEIMLEIMLSINFKLLRYNYIVVLGLLGLNIIIFIILFIKLILKSNKKL